MRVTVDTNVLARALVRDDVQQAKTASRLLKTAEIIAIPLSCLCELVWILRRVYKFKHEDVFASIHTLINAENVVVHRPTVEAGLAVLKAGGDFADGVIAYEGNWLSGETFVSFDKKAVKLLSAQGIQAKLLR